MEILNYALVAVVIAIGLILGRMLAWMAKEEVRPGKKYFLLLQKILFCAVIVTLMYANKTNVHYIWIGAVIIFAYLVYFKKVNTVITYAVLALGVYLSTKTDYFLLASSFAFLYGLPTGTMLKNRKFIALNLIVFLVVAIGLFLIVK
jgi:hypothetical protein